LHSSFTSIVKGMISHMTDVPSIDNAEVLRHLHVKLDGHFRQLNAQRKLLDPASPVFALEHDLASVEYELLRRSVRSVIAQGLNAKHRRTWLPFVIYAAESGYDYVGDEYWSSFEQSTPGWRDDQRHWIKDWFVKFSDEYGGAEPTGAFAATFTIIAWPITHAVLPTYLQRQLAELLFEFRMGLTSSLLDDPAQLGLRLASRARSYSERFQIFCQNTALLGQIAAALLSGDDEESPYLVRSTLDRIVEGLSNERQARHWLHAAQQSASRVRTTGFSQSKSPDRNLRTKQQRLPSATDPRFFLRYLDGAWQAYAEFPDLTPLNERLPRVYDELRALRTRVVGAVRPVPTGGLVYGSQEVRFKTWPDPSRPLIQLERGTEAVNAILADQCMMTQGPWWLYRRHSTGLAIEVKGCFLRPGRNYVVIGQNTQQPPAVSWWTQVPLGVSGACAYQIDVPQQLTDAESALLVAHGMSVLSTVDIRPVGIVASAWDGEGAAEWLAGEPAIIGIRSEVKPTRCLVMVDGKPHFVSWPTDQQELILSLDCLEVGSHDITAILLGADQQEFCNETFTATIRDPQIRRENATIGEGIRMLVSPARPTLTELWDEHASVTVDGPSEAEAELVVTFRCAEGMELAKVRRKIHLPISDEQWATYARSIRASRTFKDVYDEAESCELTVHRSGLGMASLTCNRGFQPLRWRFLKHHGGDVSVTLQDRTDGGQTRVDFFAVDAPLTAVPYEPSASVALPVRGGLLRAISQEAEATVLAPTNPNAVLRLGKMRPHIPHGSKSPAGIMKRAEMHRMWATAELPADPFARYQQHLALEAIARANVMLICGSHWAQLEQKLEWADELAEHLDEMQNAVGVSPPHKTLAAEIGHNLHRWLKPESLVLGFADIIAATLADSGVKDKPSAARFLLTLAGRFDHITAWPASDQNYLLERVVNSPILLRAARFAVLGTRALNDLESVERGF
jgi:hypothetical protein